MTTIEKLFIYGTLGPGQPNEYLMTDIGGTWTPASTKGTLLKEGWGADLGYPGIIPDEAAGIVRGHLFQSENLQHHWNRLDEFEGEEYERVVITVTLADGTTTKAYVYAIHPSLR